MNTALRSLFQYKAWANQELLAALAAFDAAQHPDRFRAMLDILGHANAVDRIFRNHLSGAVVEIIDSTDPERELSLSELRTVVEATDAWYLGFVADLDDARLRVPVPFVFTDGDKGTMTREEMLLHVATHAGYHRGSIGQILEDLTGDSPPDSLTKYLHRHEPGRRIHPDQGR
jgi:uncharacterized damage-inducible protein DinB